MIELQVGLTAAVIWGFAHALQYSALRYNRLIAEDRGYQTCNGIRIAAMVITSTCLLTWVWRHIPPLLDAACSMN
ncbi:MAG TPA: hypothetical protein VGM96_26015 [Reyranella sp.]|jgi:uncharacterized BrkB/YihY/UPF0761 family membrane protein